MSDKSEDPTPKRMRDSKKKGQVAKSQDATSAFLFVIGFTVLLSIGATLTDSLKELMRQYFQFAAAPDINPNAYEGLGKDLILRMLGMVFPLMGANFVIALFISYIQ